MLDIGRRELITLLGGAAIFVDDDFDVLADGVVVGRIFNVHAAPVHALDVDARLWPP